MLHSRLIDYAVDSSLTIAFHKSSLVFWMNILTINESYQLSFILSANIFMLWFIDTSKFLDLFFIYFANYRFSISVSVKVIVCRYSTITFVRSYRTFRHLRTDSSFTYQIIDCRYRYRLALSIIGIHRLHFSIRTFWQRHTDSSFTYRTIDCRYRYR